MSLDALTYAEEFFFTHDPNYRRTIYDEIKRLGIRLRLPSWGEAHTGIDGFVMTMGLQKGHAPGRSRKKTQYKRYYE